MSFTKPILYYIKVFLSVELCNSEMLIASIRSLNLSITFQISLQRVRTCLRNFSGGFIPCCAYMYKTLINTRIHEVIVLCSDKKLGNQLMFKKYTE